MKARMVAIAVVAVLVAGNLCAGPLGSGGSRSTGYATYKSGTTTYRAGSYYSTGAPRVQRSDSVRREYLRSLGYSSTPRGYEVDHIVPLSGGGADAAYNMQLLTVEQHRAKTRTEASR